MLVVYGVSGYTGRLVAAELVRRGVPFVAAGRREDSVRAALQAIGAATAPVRTFALDDREGAARALAGASVLLNLAGPFERTAVPLATAAIAAGAHYLDIAGEIGEHEAVRALGEAARSRGVMLLPGVGFGCVPTELAAAEAARRLGSPAVHVLVAYETVGEASRGTLETVLRHLHEPGLQRRGGALVPVRAAAQRERLDLGGGRALVVTNPWRADQVAVHASTGAPAIDTLASFPLAARVLMALPRFTGSRVGQALIDRIVRGAPEGPTPAQLAAGRTRVLARARDAQGRSAEVRVRGPEAYVFTARTAAAIAARVLAGGPRAGHAAPSQVFPFGELAAIDGVEVLA